MKGEPLGNRAGKYAGGVYFALLKWVVGSGVVGRAVGRGNLCAVHGSQVARKGLFTTVLSVPTCSHNTAISIL